MDTTDTNRKTPPDDTPLGPPAPLEWVDEQKRHWRVVLTSDDIYLIADDCTLTILAESWSRDIYVAPHGESFIIRFDTFDLSVAFVVSIDRAMPLLRHIGRSGDAASEPVAAHEERTHGDHSYNEPLLWPKVSPLAVWALICSSLVFVPVFGWVPATITVVLLLLHRRRVRRSSAWSHSRSLCMVAFIFLIGGSLVSLLATAGLVRSPIGTDISRYSTIWTPNTNSHSSGPVEIQAQLLAAGGAGRFDHVNWGMLASALFVVLLSLTVHEAAHATTAWWLGDDLARRLGRVTLNPIAHIDPLGTIVLPLILYLANAGVFGWARPVPVDTGSLTRPHRAHILISIAGPGSNLLLAAASLALLLGLGLAVSIMAPDAQVSNFHTLDFSSPVSASGFPLALVFGPLCTILKLSFIVNVFLAFFNLIPIPPLDGSWVLEHMFPRTLGPIYNRIRPYGFLLFLVLVYSDTPVLAYLLYPALMVLVPGFVLLGSYTTLA